MNQVWSCGGGTQSVAIGALILQGKLPKPDISVIADTGKETKPTWEYLDNILNPALAKIGVKVIKIAASEWSYYHKTGNEIFNKQGTLQIPAFTNESGQISKLPGFCSSAWKQEPIDRWLRSKGISKRDAQVWIGYSYEEQKRWVKKTLSEDFQAGLIRLPLVHDVPTNRNGCVGIIRDMGWPAPTPKSRCWMCPNQNDDEWRELTPEEFGMAVALDKEIRKKDPNAWLHRQCVPLDEVDFSLEPDLFSRACDSGLCFV